MSLGDESSTSIYSFLQSQVVDKHKLIVRQTERETAQGPVYHAVDGGGHPTLLIPLDAAAIPSIEWENKLVSLSTRIIEVDGSPSNFLILQCLSDRVQSQFGHIVDDILDAVEHNSNDAAIVARKTLERWKELLREDRPRMLGVSELTGLYGELHFLDQLVFHHGPSALVCWTGPFGNRHDFEFPRDSVEVKATTGSNTMSVTFHGTRQLDYDPGQKLSVVVYQIERIPQGTSVPMLLERLIDAGVPRVELFERMEMVGYYEQDAVHYAPIQFNILGTKVVAVNSSFPRITRQTIATPSMLDSISRLQYSVDIGPLAGCNLSLDGLLGDVK